MNALRTVTAASGLVAAVGALVQPAPAAPKGGKGGPHVETLELTGVVRDFEPWHADFDVVPPDGFGQYMWNIDTALGVDGKPVFVGGGYKVLSQAHDFSGRPICWTMCNPDIGDTPAEPDGPDNGSISSAETFDEWFRDIPGVSLSTLATVSGPLRLDGEYAGMYEINEPQFYPIDDMLFGNDGNHNHFFTFEIIADFVYDESAGYELMLIADDDAWIFVDGDLVADMGGINGSSEQWVALDRLPLTEGETYRLRIFKADRSEASSRFHLVTNIPLTNGVPPTILALYD